MDKIQAEIHLAKMKALHEIVKVQLLREQQYYELDSASIKFDMFPFRGLAGFCFVGR